MTRVLAFAPVLALTTSHMAIAAEPEPAEPVARAMNNPACAPKMRTQGAHVVVAFTATGTCNWSVPAGVTLIDFAVVAGGGGGASRAGAGGGAGGLLTERNRSVSGVSTLTVTVGAGGVGGAVGQQVGTNGGASSMSGTGFTTVSATGGGRGSNAVTAAGNGGSGGGGGGGSTLGGSTAVGTGIAGQGFAGGNGRNGNCAGSTSDWCGGGGGGAGSVGGNAALNGAAGSGGSGVAISWLTTGVARAFAVGQVSGTQVFFAGGGGGGADFGGIAGGGGIGGGGAGSVSDDAPGFDATANTGGGGGGSGYHNTNSPGDAGGGDGGSGVVIIRYSVTSTTCSGTTSFAENSYVVVAFTAVQANCTWTVPVGVTNIEYLVVAGGGGGGARHGGGGGAGGLLTNSTPVTPGTNATITVGGGGNGADVNANGATNGGNSVLTVAGQTVATSIGGGFQNQSGGSGGGAAASASLQTVGAGTAGQGFAGGQGSDGGCTGGSSFWCGGGGGGAGAVGQAADAGNNNKAGNGGVGLTTSLFSVSAAQFMGIGHVSGGAVYFAGGGGGGVDTGGTVGTGGLGGGGNGSNTIGSTGSAGAATTGGGGGGGAYSNAGGNSGGGAGGSGVVVLRYTPNAANAQVDSAAQLNGTNQYFEVAEGTQFVSRAVYSAEAWINPTATACASMCPIFSHDGDYTLGIMNNRFTAWIYHTGIAQMNTWTTNVAPRANEWQHVALVRNGASAQFFVDGQLRESFTLGGSTRSTYTNQFVLWLGRHYTNYYTGQIDHFRLWSTARTAGDFAAAMHQHTPSVTTGLLAQYDFNNVTGTSVTNLAPGAPAGTNLTSFGTPAYRDIKSTSFVGSDVVVRFPRSYLTANGGWTMPDGASNVRALVVAGGGGGGSSFDTVGAGGGGAGGLIDRFTSSTAGLTASTVRVTVGAGGAGGGASGNGLARSQWQVAGNDGQNSVLDTLTAVGGGGGSQRSGSGRAGGSGGGAGGRSVNSAAGTATVDQGNAGGKASVDFASGGGGGGAGGAGGSSNQSAIGAGGSGRSLSITGSSLTYSTGGAGGDRGSSTTSAASAAANLGGGGAGGNGVTGANDSVVPGGNGGNGGSGVIIVRYAVTASACTPSTSRVGVHVITTFSVTGDCTWNVPAGVTSLDYLVVAGGGGGGAFQETAAGGGGGAGGMLDGTGLAVSPTQQLMVSVGAGGAGGVSVADGDVASGAQGGTSGITGAGISGLTATGGGFGSGNSNAFGGGDGGSGGGALGSQQTSASGGTGVAGPPRQGNNGGANNLSCGAERPSGGGGGAGAAGNPPTCAGDVSGAGGIGRASSITGTSVLYAGGGGGGSSSLGAVAGAAGGGGGGAGGSIRGQDAVDGLGGGGGGAGYGTTVNVTVMGGDGGDGIVIVRYVDRTVSIVQGDAQTGNAGSAAPTNPRVRVTDAAGNGIDGVTVTFTAGANSGTVGTTSATTSGGGFAETTWTFGTGSSQTVSATTTLTGSNTVTFTATVTTAYNLSYDANGGSGAPVQVSTNIGSTATVSATVPTRTGYTFSAWNTAANGSGTGYASGATFTMPANEVTLFAQWTLNSYNLVYDANSGSGAPSSSSVNFGATVNISTTRPTRTGYTFSGWNTAANGSGTSYAWNGTAFSPSSFTMGSSDVTLYAQWSINSYTVSYDANGGSGAPGSSSVNFAATATVSATVPTRTGYTFSGWNTAANGSGSSYASSATFTMPSNNVSLFAQWTLNSYNLVYDANSGSGAPSSSSVNFGATVNISTTRPTRTGYTFSGWNTAANGSGTSYAWNGTAFSPASFTLGAADVTLFAQWSINSYTVSYDANGGSGAPGSSSVNFAATATVSATVPTRTGYTFSGWNTAANGSGTSYASSATFTMPSNNVTLFAQWSINSYTVSYDANGGSGAPGSSSVNFAATATVSATVPTRTGYSFSGWNTAANGSGSSYASSATFTMPSNNVTLFAQWSINSYNLVYDANSGSGAPSSSSVSFGATVNISTTRPTRTGYSFSGWNTAANGSGTSYAWNGTAFSPSSFTMPSSNVTLFAQWSLNSYTVSYDANGGSGAPSGSSVNFGATVTVSATVPTRTGYSFSGWNTAANGSGTSYASSATFTMPSNDVILYAQWNVNSYTVSYDANGGSGAPGSSSVSFAATATVSATVPTRTGYSFSGWNTAANGSGTSYASSATFTMPSNNVTLYAQWTINSYTVTYDANGGTGAPGSQTTNYNTSVTVSATVPTRTGYSFSGWNTAANGSGSDYSAGTSLLVTAGVTLYAKWTANFYTLSFDANSGTSAPANVTGLQFGSVVTITSSVPTRTGYSFSGWNTAANGSGTSYASGAQLSMPAGNLTLFARWTATVQTLAYNANGGSGAPSSASVATDATATVSSSVPTRAGYTFLRWNTAANGSGSDYSSGATFTMPSTNVTLYAVWLANTYSVTYDANSGAGAPSAINAQTDSTVTVSSSLPTRAGYTFTSWNTQRNGGGTHYAAAATFTMPPGSVTLFAQWTANANTIAYNANGGTGAPQNSVATTDSAITLSSTAPTRTGYTFAGWNTAANGSGMSYAPGASLTMPTTHLTLFAQWNPRTYQITYDANGGTGAVSPASGSFLSTVTLTSTAPTRAGYTFLGWGTAADGSGTNYAAGGAFSVPSSNTTLYAVWVPDINDVYYVLNGGAGGPAAVAAPTASTVNLTPSVPTRTGYTFTGWNTAVNGSGTAYAWNGTAFSPSSFVMPPSDIFLYAQWSINTYSVTYAANGGTGIVPSPQSGQFQSSLTVSVSALTRSGWTFTGWNTAANGSGTQFAPGGAYVVGGADVVLHAQWERNLNALVFNAVGGQGAPSVAFGATGTTVSLPTEIPVREGYSFLGWEDSQRNSHNPGATLTMPVVSITLFAKWSINSYALTYDANGGTGTAPGAQSVVFAETVTVATSQLAREGFEFTRWNTRADGSGTAYDPNATFAMPARAVTLYAQWSQLPVVPQAQPTVTTVPRPGRTTTTTVAPVVPGPTTTTTTVPVEEPEIPSAPEPEAPTPSGGSGDGGFPWMILLATLVLLIGGGVGFRYRRPRNTNP